MRSKIVIVTLLLSFTYLQNSMSQYKELDSVLTASIKNIPALKEKVTISVSNTSIQEFMRGVANSSGLNIDVDAHMDIRIVNNFSNVRVHDMLVFLANEYDLIIDVIGNIIKVSQKNIVIEPNIDIAYNPAKELITIDVKDENLYLVAKSITARTNKNVVARTNARAEKIQCYIKEMPFEHAIEEMALSNGLTMTVSEDGFFVIEKEKEIPQEVAQQTSPSRSRNSRSQQSQRSSGNQQQSGDYLIDIKKLRNDSLKIIVEDAPVDKILQRLSEEEKFNYFISPNIEDLVSGSVVGKDLNLLLTYLFNGTKVAHKKVDNIYIIGEKNLIDYNQHKVIQLQNRSVDKISEFIPKDLAESLEMIEFTELNSLFITGPAYQIKEFEAFIRDVDKIVPVVLIEVVLMYTNKSINVATGIQAGLADEPVATGGTIMPSVDVTVGAGKINEIINGSGWVNLGNVSPNFYVTLQAMESQGFLELRSTPKLSTLNGHDASMAIGNTEYYLEENTQLYGTQNPTQTSTREYKPVTAELSLKIKPFVSGDEQITLEIEVAQSDFTERISKTAPPGTVNRDFISQIRVKNKEMILLGGLMEERKSESGTGIPILSRLPLIKWFFSSRQKSDSDEKLSLLIRPTIIN